MNKSNSIRGILHCTPARNHFPNCAGRFVSLTRARARASFSGENFPAKRRAAADSALSQSCISLKVFPRTRICYSAISLRPYLAARTRHFPIKRATTAHRCPLPGACTVHHDALEIDLNDDDDERRGRPKKSTHLMCAHVRARTHAHAITHVRTFDIAQIALDAETERATMSPTGVCARCSLLLPRPLLLFSL